jgi:hypothetical protein
MAELPRAKWLEPLSLSLDPHTTKASTHAGAKGGWAGPTSAGPAAAALFFSPLRHLRCKCIHPTKRWPNRPRREREKKDGAARLAINSCTRAWMDVYNSIWLKPVDCFSLLIFVREMDFFR